MHITGIVAALLLILSCFLPWVHFNSVHETFTGFHVTPFANGTYYGRAGIFISVLTLIVFILMFVNRAWVKGANLFIAALIFAYAIRTYLVFTASLFPGEVTRKPGIFFILIFSLILLLTTLFPRSPRSWNS